MPAPLSILIVEDEPLIAMMIEDYVDLLGHRVAGMADSVADALTLIAAGGFDVAILDVNLRDGPCWPAADALGERGIRYVLASGGHGDLPASTHAPVCQLAKPFTLDALREILDPLGK